VLCPPGQVCTTTGVTAPGGLFHAPPAAASSDANCTGGVFPVPVSTGVITL
jgi:hypothetical protein